jgi:hypothetical protein
MQPSRILAVIACCGTFLAGPAVAEPQIADARLRQRMDELAASTLQGGTGWQAYVNLLHPGYSRWAMGELHEGRESFARSLKEWWEYGMRVTSRDIEMVGVDRAGNIAIVRFLTRETFAGPDGVTGGFSGYVTNVWVHENGDWSLLSAEIATAPGGD